MADNTRKAARGGTYTIFVAIFWGVSFFLTFSEIMGDGQPVCKRSESAYKALTSTSRRGVSNVNFAIKRGQSQTGLSYVER